MEEKEEGENLDGDSSGVIGNRAVGGTLFTKYPVLFSLRDLLSFRRMRLMRNLLIIIVIVALFIGGVFYVQYCTDEQLLSPELGKNIVFKRCYTIWQYLQVNGYVK